MEQIAAPSSLNFELSALNSPQARREHRVRFGHPSREGPAGAFKPARQGINLYFEGTSDYEPAFAACRRVGDVRGDSRPVGPRTLDQHHPRRKGAVAAPDHHLHALRRPGDGPARASTASEHLQDQGTLGPDAAGRSGGAHAGESVVRQHGQRADGSLLRLSAPLRRGHRSVDAARRRQGISGQAAAGRRSPQNL